MKKLTYNEFVEKYKGDMTEKEFLDKLIIGIQGCYNCKHWKHEDFKDIFSGACGNNWDECNFELDLYFLKEKEVLK